MGPPGHEILVFGTGPRVEVGKILLAAGPNEQNPAFQRLVPKHDSCCVEDRQIAGDGKGVFDSADDIHQEVAVASAAIRQPHGNVQIGVRADDPTGG